MTTIGWFRFIRWFLIAVIALAGRVTLGLQPSPSATNNYVSPKLICRFTGALSTTGSNCRSVHSALFSQPITSNDHHGDNGDDTSALTVHQALSQRYACPRFQRFDGVDDATTEPTEGNTTIIEQAHAALDVARRAPSGFNVQPYKLLLVSSPEAKEAMAAYCIGRNAHRVRDSDCTALFLADRESLRTLPEYRKLLFQKSSRWKKNTFALCKIQVLVGLFSSGLPLPKWISGPISWCVRVAMRCFSWVTRKRLPLPTLSSADVWAQKNTLLVAMAYLLECTSRGLATCPMEGYQTWGIRQALGIPRRYAIPLIVSTGRPYERRPSSSASSSSSTESSDDAGMTHGVTSKMATLRYPIDQIVFSNRFGQIVR